GLRPELVNDFGGSGAHAFPPGGASRRIALLLRVRVGASGDLLGDIFERSIHGAGVLLLGVGDRLFRGEAAIDEGVVVTLSAPLFHLVQHGRELLAVAAGVGHVHAHDQAAVGVGRELSVVAGAIAAVGKLDVAGLGIGGGSAGLFRRLARNLRSLLALLLQLVAVGKRRFDALHAFPRRPLACRLLTAIQFRWVLVRQAFERFHLFLRFGVAALERGFAAE